jgi:hypothetical protein
MATPPNPAISPPSLDDEDEDEDDLGSPVLELLALRAPPTPGFHRRLTRRIERRRVAADLTTLGVTGPLTAVLEVLAGLLQPARPTPRRPGGSQQMARRHLAAPPDAEGAPPPESAAAQTKTGSESGPPKDE